MAENVRQEEHTRHLVEYKQEKGRREQFTSRNPSLSRPAAKTDKKRGRGAFKYRQHAFRGETILRKIGLVLRRTGYEGTDRFEQLLRKQLLVWLSSYLVLLHFPPRQVEEVARNEARKRPGELKGSPRSHLRGGGERAPDSFHRLEDAIHTMVKVLFHGKRM